MTDKQRFHSIQVIPVILIALILQTQNSSAQLVLSGSSTENTNCEGIDCSYEGPSILINEIMASPSFGDGSIYGSLSGSTREAEWIELYNPDLCEWVDISCYFLGNSAPDGTCQPGGFILPEGSVVPPMGFAVIRGVNAPAVPPELLVENDGNTIEIVVDDPNVICLGASFRLWFPNAGGWFAFYDNNGVPQDAISWNNSQCSAYSSCNPGPVGNCDYNGGLMSYNDIPADRKTYVSSSVPTPDMTWGRVPDGGDWQYNTALSPTYGTCNGDCALGPEISCEGTATVNVSGGTPPYQFQWDDSMLQTDQTATGLCEGTYCVTVTDSTGVTASICIEVLDYIIENINTSSNSDICEGETLSLSVSGESGYSYSWTGPNGFSSADQNPSVPFAAVSASGTYGVIVTNPEGCTGTASETVLINPNPDANAGNDEMVCGLETNLSAIPAQPGETGQWALSGGPGTVTFSDTGDPGSHISVSAPGEYEFSWTVETLPPAECISTDYVNITFNEILNPAISPVPDICISGEPVEITIEDIGELSSSPDINDQVNTGIITPASLVPGTYTITNQVSGPCVTSSQDQITFEVFGHIQISNFNDQNCINAQTEYEISWTVLDWDGNPTSDYEINGNSQSSPDYYEVHPSGTTYGYNITDINGCTSIDLNGIRNCNCPSPGTMSSLEVVHLCGNECSGGSVFHNQDSVMISGSLFGFIIHSGDNIPLSYNSTPDFCRQDFGGEYNTIYYISSITGYDQNSNGIIENTESCFSVSQGTPVVWMELPVVNAGIDKDTCGLIMQFEGNQPEPGMIGYWTSDCNFTPIGNTDTHDPDMTALCAYGTWTFTWHIGNGSCISEDNVTMTFNQIPAPFAGNDTTVCGNQADLSAENSLPGTTFQWSGSLNFDPAIGTETQATANNYGAYYITLTEYSGSCFSQDIMQVNFVPVPQPYIINNNDSVCGTMSQLTVLNSNNPGFWSAFENGTQIYPVFGDPTATSTTVNVSNWTGTFRTVEFIWTEISSYQGVQCTGQASCNITFAKPVNAFIDGDDFQEGCGNEFTLNASTVGLGDDDTGTWIISSVNGYFTPDNHAPDASFTMTSQGSFGGNASLTIPCIWAVNNGVCSDLDTLTMTLYMEPQASAGDDDSTCGLSYQLRAIYDLPAGSPDYEGSGSWSSLSSNPGGSNFVSMNSDSTLVNVETAGVYGFVWRENNSLYPFCFDKDTVWINFKEIPVIDAGDDFDVCGNHTTLNAISAGFDFNWQPVEGVTYDDYTDPGTGVTVAGYGQYVFPSIEPNDECVATDSVVVTFWRHPSAEAMVAVDDTTVCGLVFDRLRAENPGDGVVGNWIAEPGNGVHFHTQTYDETVDVNFYGHYNFYWVESIGPDNEGPDFCTDTSEAVPIHFIEIPDANAGSDTVFCGHYGSMAAELSVPGTASGTWTDLSNNINIEDEHNPSSPVSLPGSLLIQNLPMVWTENNMSCTNSDTVIVGFARIPVADMAIIPPRCEGEPASIKAKEDTLRSYTWEWNGGLIDSVWPANAHGANFRYLVGWPGSNDTAHIVGLVVENYWGCQSPINEDTVYEPYLPEFRTGIFPDTCALGRGGFAFYPDTTTDNPGFSWVDTTHTVVPVPVYDTVTGLYAGTYRGVHSYRTFNNAWSTQYIAIFGTDQCIDTFEFAIDTAGLVYAEIAISSATDLNALVAPNAEVWFDNLSDGDNVRTSCTWYFGDGESTNSCEDQISHVYSEPNDCYQPYFVIRVRNIPECRDTAFLDCLKIDDMSSLEIPNIFTPNGDGMNDFFQVKAQTLQSFRGMIVNRWGRTIYEWSDYETEEAGWDGKLSGGGEAASGVYYYIIKAVGMDGLEYDETGPFHLVREK